MGRTEASSWRGRRSIAVVAVAVVFLGALATVRPLPGRAAPNQFVTVSDGVQIAVNVRLPDGYVPGRRYPTVFEMSGYDGGSAEDGTLARDLARATGVEGLPLQDDSRQLTRMFNAQYATVHASVRGTGCSSGEFDLFSWRSALDGREVIDGWIAAQPWSNGDVAIMGHSYGGITGMMVAATRPAHLRAVTVSGLVDDLYRGLLRPGGVANVGFPVTWGAGVRPAYDVAAGLAPGLVRPEEPDDTPGRRVRCAANVAGKSRTVLDEPAFHALSETDGPWFRARSLVTTVDRVAAPTHVAGSHQDELTGPRGAAHLWERLRGVPRRLVLTNGDHATNQGPEVMADRKAWVDHWLLGADAGYGSLTERRSSVTTMLETRQGRAGARLSAHSFPYETTRWTDWYLHAGGRLSP
ncbi:MAG: CocE/NonD family hydrolase, partial [Actinomycetota bacterium]|nr:CocE/NonD family hydrolase [Actinomycetota bacterium]